MLSNASTAAAVERTVKEIGAVAASLPEDAQLATLAWAQGYRAGRASAVATAAAEPEKHQ